MMERRHGSFQRSVRLPDTVDEDNVEANFDNGVLKIRLPKLRKLSANSGQSRLRRARVRFARFA